MGQSTDAVLVYGYNLGGEDEWKVEEATGEYGELNLAWLDTGEDNEAGFTEQAERRLLAAAGFTETDWRAEGYFARQREAEERVGVKFKSYRSGDYPIYTLAAHVITVNRGDIKMLDLAALQRQPAENGWDAKLADALRVLGLTPKQARPGWLLCSYWG